VFLLFFSVGSFFSGISATGAVWRDVGWARWPAMGFATEGTEGTEPTRVTQVCSVVSVILCGLSCPCVLFILSVVVRRASGGWHGHAKRGHGTTNAPLHRQDMPTQAWACHPAPMGQGERGHATQRCWSGRAGACPPGPGGVWGET